MNNLFIPNKYKYKKVHKKVRIKKGKDYKMNYLNHSICGLKVLESGTVSAVVLEATRRVIKRKIKRTGSLKINGFAYVPITKKASGVRMGKGSGSIDSWVFPIKKGRILFELDNVSIELAQAALRSAAKKLNLRSKIVYKS